MNKAWLFATLPATQRVTEEVARLTDIREIRELLRSFFGRRAVRVVGVVALLVVVVVLLFLILNWYVAPTKPGERKDLVLVVAQILGATALLSGLYFTWRNLQVNREGQVTERFTHAIDQLGKTDNDGEKLLEVRLGGIYALERIARESEQDHGPVMEVLTAYFRQHAPWPPEKNQEVEQQYTAVQKSDKTSENARGVLEPAEIPTPDLDIQAIMTVLRRRTRTYGHGEPERLYLRKTNFSRANLWRGSLSGADLRETNFSSALLRETNLSDAVLWEALLCNANLRDADLRQAHFRQTDLSEANLSGANLSGTDLSGTLHLTQEQLEETTGDRNTKLPPNLKPPAHWGVKPNEKDEED